MLYTRVNAMDLFYETFGCHCEVNPLAPGRYECYFKNVIFNLVLLIGIFRSAHDNDLRRMPQDLTDDKSTLVRVMAWCRQATTITWANVDSVPCRLMVSLGQLVNHRHYITWIHHAHNTMVWQKRLKYFNIRHLTSIFRPIRYVILHNYPNDLILYPRN